MAPDFKKLHFLQSLIFLSSFFGVFAIYFSHNGDKTIDGLSRFEHENYRNRFGLIQTTLFWAIMDCYKPFLIVWTISGHFGPFEAISSYFRLLPTVWAFSMHFGQIQAILNHLRLLRVIRDCYRPF
jgi:hypothetical protein